MARVTVEDCIDKVENRFELVMLAAQRARKIGTGAALLVERDNDKNPVVALREIAGEKVQTSDLREELIKNHQHVIEMEDGEDVIDMMDGEQEWGAMAEGAHSYADQDIDDDDDIDDEPSLEDLAGGAPAEEENF